MRVGPRQHARPRSGRRAVAHRVPPPFLPFPHALPPRCRAGAALTAAPSRPATSPPEPLGQFHKGRRLVRELQVVSPPEEICSKVHVWIGVGARCASPTSPARLRSIRASTA